MANNTKCCAQIEQETLNDLQEFEALAPMLPEDREEIGFQLMMAELLDQIEDVSSYTRASAKLHQMVARLGDAYFFYNETGDLCLLSGFLSDRSILEA